MAFDLRNSLSMKREEAIKCISLLASDRNQTQRQARGGKKMPLGVLKCYTWLSGIVWYHDSKWPKAALLWGYSEYAGSAVQVSCEEVATKSYFHTLVQTDMQPRSSSHQKLFVIFTLKGSGILLENCLKLWLEAHAWLDFAGTTNKKLISAEPSPRNKLAIYEMLC